LAWLHLGVLVGVSTEVNMTYSEVEGVTPDDLMCVRGRPHAWVDERIGTLDSELRASESKHVLRRGRLRKERASGK
jgi:hypothetical protein